MKAKAFDLYPLVEYTNKKLDYENLERMLIDGKGRLTTAGKYFGISSVNYRFDEKDKQEKYKLFTELSFNELKLTDFRVLLGERGLFLKYNKSLDFNSVNSVVKSLNELINTVKLFLYIPIGKAYYSDGTTYLRNDDDLWSAKRAGVTYVLFNDESEAE